MPAGPAAPASTATAVGGLAPTGRPHAPPPARHVASRSAPLVRAAARPATAAPVLAALEPAHRTAPAPPPAHRQGGAGGQHPRGHHRPPARVAMPLHLPSAPAPPSAPAAAAGAAASSAAGSIFLPLALLAALLLLGSAEPYGQVAVLRWRALTAAGGRRERPG